MNIKLIKINKNIKVVQDMFNTMSRILPKDEIQQLVFTDSYRDLYYVVAKYCTPMYNNKVVFGYLINLLAQVDIDHVSSLLDQATTFHYTGLYGLQINSPLRCCGDDCYIIYCILDDLMLRYTDFENLNRFVDLKNSEINTLLIVLDDSIAHVQNHITLESQIYKWLSSNNVKVNNLQFEFK